MAVGYGHLGNDAHYLSETARLFGWHTVWERDRTAARLTRGLWSVHLMFWPVGGFRAALVRDGAGGERELGLAQVVALLEREGAITRLAA